MSSPGNERSPMMAPAMGPSGYTLLEIIVTLTLIAAIVALVSPTFGVRTTETELRATALKISNALRIARTVAINRGSEVPVQIVSSDRSVRVNGTQVLRWDSTLSVTSPTGEGIEFSFDARGRVNKPTLLIAENERSSISVEVGMFTGRPVIR